MSLKESRSILQNAYRIWNRLQILQSQWTYQGLQVNIGFLAVEVDAELVTFEHFRDRIFSEHVLQQLNQTFLHSFKKWIQPRLAYISIIR